MQELADKIRVEESLLKAGEDTFLDLNTWDRSAVRAGSRTAVAGAAELTLQRVEV
jgi:hypothetical protein